MLDIKKGDKIVCVHQGLYYAAKCIGKRTGSDGEFEYKVHYTGWKPKWDEWITTSEERIEEYDPSLVGLRKNAKGQDRKVPLKKIKKARMKGSGESPKMESPGSSEMALALMDEDPPSMEVDPNECPDEPKSASMQLSISPAMTEWLQEDYYQVNGLKRLPVIPAPLSVHDFLLEYKKFKLNDLPPSQHSYLESVVAGFEKVFNSACGARLIYTYEHKQYENNLKLFKGGCLSRIYGFPHLLRLFYVLTDLLERPSGLELTSYVADMQDIVDYASQHGKEHFQVQHLYGMTSADYARMAHQPL